VACGKPPEHDADQGEADERSDGGGHSVSKSRAKRRLRLIHTNVLSTIQRFGRTSSRATSDRLTICRLQAISANGKNEFDEREQSSCLAQQMESTVTVLNVGRMNDDIQQEAQHVDQDVPFATL
jgi:hypothetical protein